jgi:predicted hydrocarbon binding protein
MSTAEQLKYLQGMMIFLASVANGVEELVGRGAPSVTFRAGRNIGLKADVATRKTNLIEAFDVVRDELHKLGIHWEFEHYKRAADVDLLHHDEEGTHLKLVFRDCMVRSCQFCYGHPQKNSLCMLQHGIFCGLLQKIYGAWADYEPIHSGENACIGMLNIKTKG